MASPVADSKDFLGTEPLRTLVPRLALPMVVSQLVNLLYSIVDRMFVGHIPGAGADALTGMGVCMPMITLVLAFALWPGVGGGPMASRELGAGDVKRARAVFSNSFSLLLIFGFFLMAVLYPSAPIMLRFFGASDATLTYALRYAYIYLIGTLFVMGNLGLLRFMVAQGSTKQVLVSQAVGAGVNIVLDALFILVFDLGIQGAAAATVIAQFLSCCIALRYLNRADSVFRGCRPCRLDPVLVRRILALGLASFFINVSDSLMLIALNSQLQLWGGDVFVACMIIMQSIMSIIWTPTMGITYGAQSIIAYSFGAGMLPRTKQSIKVLIVTAFSVEFALTLAAMLFSRQIAGLFTTDAAVLDLAARAIPLFICGLLVFGVQLAIQSSFLALGQAKYPIMVAAVRKVALMIPLALILPNLFGLGAWGVFLAEPISDVTSVIVCGLIFHRCWKRLLVERQ